MAVKVSKQEKKIAYDLKLCQLLDEYSQVLVVAADNVGSNHLQNIRKGLRGDSIVLMGKNTMMKRSIKVHAEKTGNDEYLNILPLLAVCCSSISFSSSLSYLTMVINSLTDFILSYYGVG